MESPDPCALPEVDEARFILREELGRGAMGSVWRALDRERGLEVALKLLLDPGHETHRLRFVREGQVARAIEHPGVCRLIDMGRLGAQLFLAYELVAGARTLHDVFPQAHPRRRLELLRDAALALGAAHSLGVVHRDVKPANVLVDSAGQVRVTDFGAACGAHLEDLTATGAMVGTPAYMSPEQVTGRREAIGPATDVWALGVMLYECITERCPFEAETLAGFVSQVVAARYRAPRELVPSLPAVLEQIVRRALRAEPRERYPDASAFAAALQLYLGESAGASGELGHPIGPRRSLRVAASALVGGGALIALTALLVLWPKEALPPSPQVARPQASPKDVATPQDSPSPPELGQFRGAAERSDPSACLALAEQLLAEGDRPSADEWFLKGGPAGLRRAGQLSLPSDPRRALQLWRDASAGGDAEADVLLGDAYARGVAQLQADPEQALVHYRRAADAQLPAGLSRLGVALYTGEGAPKDQVAARGYLRAAAQARDPAGMAQFGVMEEFGYGEGRPSPEAAVRWYRAAAASGNRLGQTNLGVMLESGKGVARDLPEAARWYRAAVAQGSSRAHYHLGRLLLQGGDGLPKDPAEGQRLLRLARDAGDRKAALVLGMFLLERDPVEARRSFQAGAKGGHPRCWFRLGLCFETGAGGDKDLGEAFRCYRQAHQAGFTPATTALGVCYEWGRGVAADLPRALALYRDAAERGGGRAMAWLGLLHEKGKGVPRDAELARRWFERGAALDDSTCKRLLAARRKGDPAPSSEAEPAGAEEREDDPSSRDD